MKKLLLKIRHKLIHLLGGFTEQYAAPTQRYYVQKDVGIITLQDNAYFPIELTYNPEYQKRLMEQIAHRIAVQMLDAGMIRFTETSEPYLLQGVMHGWVKVLDPHMWVMFDGWENNEREI